MYGGEEKTTRRHALLYNTSHINNSVKYNSVYVCSVYEFTVCMTYVSPALFTVAQLRPGIRVIVNMFVVALPIGTLYTTLCTAPQ